MLKGCAGGGRRGGGVATCLLAPFSGKSRPMLAMPVLAKAQSRSATRSSSAATCTNPLRSLDEIRADNFALEQETEGLLMDIVGGAK
ncbi:MAG: hypothetical protein DWQ34_21205 [Planctomycetota bacterium]|nr:MAG: hypothetical protein DWQ34_21205 [Planctomycetota bacterium]REK29280.1 MAG: hypothetical protein DWQ45_23200 [Planctomycetota bacterium]